MTFHQMCDPEPAGGRKWAPAPAVEPLNRQSQRSANENDLTLDANPSDAPCCVKLEDSQGRSVLFQTDWDWPSVASLFGWSPCHNSTDGTIDCPECGKTASAMIQEAREWLDEHDGESCENPGYELE